MPAGASLGAISGTVSDISEIDPNKTTNNKHDVSLA